MKISLTKDTYGKSAVRIAKITRHADYHEFKEIHVNIRLKGDFETVYSQGDNSRVLPTDTMKNTIFVLAKEHPLTTTEDFGLYLAEYFLQHNPQVSKVSLELAQIRWERMPVDGSGHPHTFIGGSNEKAYALVQSDRNKVKLQSGIRQLRLLKTTDSGFENYITDKFTTLPPAADRILATEMEATWSYASEPKGLDFQQICGEVRECLLAAFAGHHSLSMQHTLFEMGQKVLKNVDAVAEISLKMPNLHYLPVNMKPFGIAQQNEVFIASGDAFGFISGTLKKSGQQ